MTPIRATDATRRSPFTGADVCAQAGLRLPAGQPGPRFDDDLWDFTDVAGLPVEMPLSVRRLDFTAIISRWRLVAKELMLALLAPRHPAVTPLPRAYRTPLHLRTCHARLAELARLLNWLTEQGLTTLDQVSDDHCHAYLAHRRHASDNNGRLISPHSPTTRRAAAQAVIDLVHYRDLFTSDRLPAQLRPWNGAAPSAIAEMLSGRQQNKTPPVTETVLQPLLAAALYLLDTVGPHAAALARDARQATRTQDQLPAPWRCPARQITEVLDRCTAEHQPLSRLPEHDLRQRLTHGWASDDPLLPVSLRALANQAGVRQFHARWLPSLREPIETTLARVGVAKPWGRHAEPVPRADRDGHLPWTEPLYGAEVVALAGIVRTATAVIIAAVSGMRSSELMELTIASLLPAQQVRPGLFRHRLASKIVKGQPLGGTADEWVVIEPVYRAAELAAQLLDEPGPDTLLLGRFAFQVRYKWFRAWVNSPAGRRLGLALIPDGNVTLRMLRRSLAIELAYRPGGVLATKIALKHVSVATTEGYISRPGGAQGELLAEVNKHEQQRNLDLVAAEFRNYQNGVLPAGPGAHELIEFFAGIDGQLSIDASATPPKVQPTDRDVLNLLSKRAKTLHLGIANYCWFTDPARALCLKLAGTPNASKPLAGTCDSARCAQATHHAVHRPVWAEHEKTTKIFLGQLGQTRTTEKNRLQDDYERARRVLTEIDRATGPADGPAC
jgi:integrase